MVADCCHVQPGAESTMPYSSEPGPRKDRALYAVGRDTDAVPATGAAIPDANEAAVAVLVAEAAAGADGTDVATAGVAFSSCKTALSEATRCSVLRACGAEAEDAALVGAEAANVAEDAARIGEDAAIVAEGAVPKVVGVGPDVVADDPDIEGVVPCTKVTGSDDGRASGATKTSVKVPSGAGQNAPRENAKLAGTNV